MQHTVEVPKAKQRVYVDSYDRFETKQGEVDPYMVGKTEKQR